ncbi:MAG: hypothetical protein NVS2B6_04820 [Thermoleophilaceae bacterium]
MGKATRETEAGSMVGLATFARLSVTVALAVAGLALLVPPAPGAERAQTCPGGFTGYRVGAARTDITPTQWPVAEAAYSVGRIAVGAAHPFYARSIAIQSCPTGRTVVFTALDSQGYFAAYKEDPGPGADGYGTVGIRMTVERDTGLPVGQMVIAATHTHNSPDSVGVWGGGTSANNKGPYLARVKAQTVASIEAALAALRPATLRAGSADVSAALGTYPEVSHDPVDYPTDHVMRVLQATDPHTCKPIATLVNAGIHADIAGPIDGPAGQLIDPDWPGRVAGNLEGSLAGETAVVMAGAVGRTGPSFPSGTDPGSKDQLVEIAAYGDVLARRAGTAIADASPVANAQLDVSDFHLREEIAQPALVPLFLSETGVPGVGGVMRSILPPYTVGTVLDAEVQTFRLGTLLFAGAPGEAYPEVATELARRVHGTSAPFVFGLANDQLGYTPPAFEYPVVALVDGGDEGFFTINAHFGDDIINQHLSAAGSFGLTADAPYNGATAGPVIPPDQGHPPPQPPNPPEPAETPLSLGCSHPAGSAARGTHARRQRHRRKHARQRRGAHVHQRARFAG